MAVTAHWYDKGMLNQWGTLVNWTVDTIKVALCTSTYAPSQAADQFFSDVTNEVVGTGYTAGGATLTTATKSLASHVVKLTGDNSVWAGSTITARFAVIYKSTGVAATSQLLGFVDFGANVSSTSASFTITWDATGIFTITLA